MKFLSTLFIILFSLTVALAQDKVVAPKEQIQGTTSYPIEASTFTTIGDSYLIEASTFTTIGDAITGPVLVYDPATQRFIPAIEKQECIIDFDMLPDKIVLVFKNGKQRDTKIEFTKQQVWRFICYFHDSYLVHIDRAYDLDQPESAK